MGADARVPVARAAAVALAALLALAGCGGKSSPQAGASAPAADDALFSLEDGAITGRVVNEEALPVAGAQIVLTTNVSHAARTDADGAFALAHVPPGPHGVVVQALGYVTQTRSVLVHAGAAVDVGFTLAAEAVPGVPFSKVLPPFKGRFFCAFYSPVVTGPCNPFPATEPLDQITGAEQNIFILPQAIAENKTTEQDTLGTAVVEVSWVAGSTAARFLLATLEQTPANGGRNITAITWASANGTSPLKATLTPGQASPGGRVPVPLNATGFTIGVFPWRDPGVPLAPTAFLQQDFDVWITLFYNQPAPADYTVLEA